MIGGFLFAGHHVSFTRGSYPLVEPFSFEVKAGDWVWICGPNGSGKSSFLRLLAGLLPLTTGTFTWGMVPYDVCNVLHRKKIAYLSTTAPGLWCSNQTLPEIRPLPQLREWGLHPFQDMPARFLSQGQQQRLALAIISALNRPLWLLDEPLQNLDAAGKLIFENALRSHLQKGGLAFIVSHEKLELQANHQLTFA